MTATIERQPNPDQGVTKVRQEREELGRSIASKPDQASKERQARDVLMEFLALTAEADEAVNNLVRAQGLPLSPEKKAQAENIAKGVGRVLEIVKLASQGNIRKEAVGRIQENSYHILQKLDAKTAGLIDEQTAPFIFPLVKKLVQGSLSGAAMVKEYTELDQRLRAYNPHLLSRVRETIIDVASEGRLDMSADDIEREINPRIQDRANRRVHERTEEPTLDDKERFDKLRETIYEKLEANIKGDEDNKLNPREAAHLRAFLLGDMNIDQAELVESLQKLGYTEMVAGQEVAEFKRLFDKIFGHEDLQRLRGMWLTDKNLIGILEKAARDFDINNLLAELRELQGPDGSLSPEAAIKFKSRFKKLITKYYSMALETVHTNHSQFFDKSFTHQHQYFTESLRGIIRNVSLTLRDSFFVDSDPRQKWAPFFTDVSGRYQSTLLTNAETLHNLPLYARDAGSFEKWSQFLGYLFPSEFAEVFDPEDSLMENARREITLHLRRRIIENGNRIPADLFSGNFDRDGVIYSLKDYDQIEEGLKKRMIALGRGDIEDWEYQRARTYAIGLGLANLDDPTLIGTADPNVGADFKGIYPIVTNVSARHNWGVGRGYPASGEVPDLLAMDVTLFPEQRGFFRRLFQRRKWVPEQFHQAVLDNVRRYGDTLYDQLLDRDGQYQELLNMINIGAGLTSRGGWRTEPLRNALKALAKEIDPNLDLDMAAKTWTSTEWNRYFDLATSQYGTASLWWLISAARSDSEMKRLLATRIGQERALAEYDSIKYRLTSKGIEGEAHLQFEMEVTEAGVSRRVKVNLLEARNMRQNALRGETFYRYLYRNPGDFVMLLTQLVPDLLHADSKYLLLRCNNEKNIRAKIREKEEEERQRLIGEGKRPPPKKTDLEIDQIIGKRTQLIKRWGASFEKIQEIREWLTKHANGDEKGFIHRLTNDSTTAFDRLLENERGKKPQDRRIFLGSGDFAEGDIKTALFDTGGLMEILKKEDFGDFDRIGEIGFFYRMGEVWTLKQADINPYTSDVNYQELYQNLGKVGEDANKRWLSDAATTKKLIDEISKLDKALLAVAVSGDMTKIYELHQLVYDTLKNIISKEYAHRANYILASIVSKFFVEHSSVRGGLFGLFNRLLLGKKISLSQIITKNRHAKTMDTNALRTYYRELSFNRHLLPTEGAWSHEQLESAFDATTGPFVVREVSGVFLAIFAFLIWSYIKKALEESEGKKK